MLFFFTLTYGATNAVPRKVPKVFLNCITKINLKIYRYNIE